MARFKDRSGRTARLNIAIDLKPREFAKAMYRHTPFRTGALRSKNRVEQRGPRERPHLWVSNIQRYALPVHEGAVYKAGEMWHATRRKGPTAGRTWLVTRRKTFTRKPRPWVRWSAQDKQWLDQITVTWS